jgi:FkbM family methyltransferase
MNKTLRKFGAYHYAFGCRGFWLAVRTKLSRRIREEEAVPPSSSHPLCLRLKTSDLDAYTKIFMQREYDIPLGKEPKVIVDAGANVGFASVFFAIKYPKAKVVAIEPEGTNFVLLKKNTAPYPNIIPIQAALWRENTQVELVDRGFGHWGFQVEAVSSPSDQQHRLGSVQALTFDRIMSLHGFEYIDILKMDIEGGEKDIFAGNFSWVSQVGVIVVELHDRLTVGCSRNFYVATKDFDQEIQQGENVILLRKDYLAA